MQGPGGVGDRVAKLLLGENYLLGSVEPDLLGLNVVGCMAVELLLGEYYLLFEAETG